MQYLINKWRSNSIITMLVDTMVENNICPIGNTLDFFNRKWIFCILSIIINVFNRQINMYKSS